MNFSIPLSSSPNLFLLSAFSLFLVLLLSFSLTSPFLGFNGCLCYVFLPLFSSSHQIAQCQGESALASSYKSTIGELEKDKSSLQQQVGDLQTALVSSQNTPSSQIDVDMDGE